MGAHGDAMETWMLAPGSAARMRHAQLAMGMRRRFSYSAARRRISSASSRRLQTSRQFDATLVDGLDDQPGIGCDQILDMQVVAREWALSTRHPAVSAALAGGAESRGDAADRWKVQAGCGSGRRWRRRMPRGGG